MIRTWVHGLAARLGRLADARSRADPLAAARTELRNIAQDGSREAVEAALARARSRASAGDDLELEMEQLQGRLDLLQLEAAVAECGLPRIATQHKAIAADTCHFVASVSLVTAGAQTAGTLLLTGRRMLLLGAGTLTRGWSAVHDVRVHERDLVIESHDGSVLRLVCNSFSEARRGGFIARCLLARRT